MQEVQRQYEAAQELLKRNRASEALELLAQIAAQNPNFAPAHNDLGVLLVHAGHFDRAVPHLARCWELTGHIEAAKNLAYAFRCSGKKDYAISALQQARAKRLVDANLYKLLSELLLETERFPELQNCLLEWRAWDPKDFSVVLRLMELSAVVTHSLREQLSSNREQVEEFISALEGHQEFPQQLQTDDPRIVVGIPTRNRREPLYVMLSSLGRQTYRNFEVLISDDSDELGLEEEVRRIFPDLSIRYVRGPQVSLPANRAHIFLHSAGEYVVMCDDDHYMLPDCLELLVKTMRENSDAAIVSAVWPHPFENPKLIDFEQAKNQRDHRLDIDDVGCPEDFWWKNGCEAFKSYCLNWPLLESQIAGGGCLMYRRSAVMSVGGFPRECSFVSFREDTDMSHRLYLAGYRILVQTGSLAFHLRATEGGCRDGKSWGERLVRDGLGFLERLKVWREEHEQRKTLRIQGPIKVRLSAVDPAARIYWEELLKHAGGDVQVVSEAAPGVLEIGESVLTVFTPEAAKNAEIQLRSGKALAIVTPVLSIAEDHQTQREWSYLPVPDKDDKQQTLKLCSIGETKSELQFVEGVCKELGLELLPFSLQEIKEGQTAAALEKCEQLIGASQLFVTFSAPGFIPRALSKGLDVITSPALARDFATPQLLISENSEANLRRQIQEALKNKLERVGTQTNVADSRGIQATLLSVLGEIQRRKQFGVKRRAEVDEQMVYKLVEENFSDKPRRPVSSYVTRTAQKITMLSADFLPLDASGFEQLVKQLSTLRPFHFHYGGAGDALLLLSTFYDVQPQTTIFSCATSPRTMEAFFAEFPQLEQVYVVELPETSTRQAVLRYAIASVTNCIGRGATPLSGHEDEWVNDLDVTKAYGVQLYPSWIKQFRPLQLCSRQVAVAPKGSCLHMIGGKRNTIPEEIWSDTISAILRAGFTPVVLGTPDEAPSYPILSGVIDKRSCSFSEQMSVINGSEIFVGADSWGKTFSAMTRKPTIVFEPTVDGVFTSSMDVSANAFIRPWKNIGVISSVSELYEILSGLGARSEPASAAL